jgi:hypothetical protein
MIRFSIFSIPVEIQPFFWVTLVILGGVSGADTAAQILEIGLFVIAGFVSILIHELGHAQTARWFGANSSITLQAFGGYATYSGTHLNRWKSFVVTAAGPLAQIALAFIVLFIMQKIPNLTELGSLFLSTLIFISFFGPSSIFSRCYPSTVAKCSMQLSVRHASKSPYGLASSSP